MTDAYRSYVVRVRRRASPVEAIRLELEDLLDGHRAALTGDEARRLADRLLAAFDPQRPQGLAGIRSAGRRQGSDE